MMSTTKRAQPLKLSTTSYSVLSHLALKPWSAYELAVQRIRYFRLFWPRAERGLYDELKRLAAAGLAEADVEYTGRRQRTVYSITPAGRTALHSWLDEPVSPLALEFEGLLRVFSAPLGTAQQFRENLDRIAEDLRSLSEFNDGVVREYIEGRAPFQSQAYVRTFVVDFLTDFLTAAEAWVDRTRAEVGVWTDVKPDRAKMAKAVERMRVAQRRRARMVLPRRK
jgi:PadR family transcriptional regulator, regulatory protein AphA